MKALVFRQERDAPYEGIDTANIAMIESVPKTWPGTRRLSTIHRPGPKATTIPISGFSRATRWPPVQGASSREKHDAYDKSSGASQTLRRSKKKIRFDPDAVPRRF